LINFINLIIHILKLIFNKHISNDNEIESSMYSTSPPRPSVPVHFEVIKQESKNKTPEVSPLKMQLNEPLTHETVEVKPEVKERKAYNISFTHMIPVEDGQAVSTGWPFTGGKPNSVTWHWTATTTRRACDIVLGGKNAYRKPQWDSEKKRWTGGASAHYCIGRSEKEGISQYISLENRSWHAGVNQTLRWDGRPVKANGQLLTATRTSIGIETVTVGYERDGFKSDETWLTTYSPGGRKMVVQSWTEEQIDMMIFIGREIVKKYPNIGYLDHHGHMDICPGFKDDCSFAFPFARVLSGIYDVNIPDVWTAFDSIINRQKALRKLGYSITVDGIWGRMSEAALRKFQTDRNATPNGVWTTFVCWEVYFALLDKGYSLDEFIN